MDRAAREWTAACGLDDFLAHVIRSQPYENARRVFRDMRDAASRFGETIQKLSSPEQWVTRQDADWAMALFAIEHVFNNTITDRWIFETLRFFWPLDVVAQWLHTLFPEHFFPVSAELFWRTDRFRRYCLGLGVDVEWPTIKDHPLVAYLEVDEAIRSWAGQCRMAPWQVWAVFEHLAPRLFPDEDGPLPERGQVWISMSSDESFEGLDNPEETTQIWTANPQIRRGDIVLMYCMSPRKALTHRFRALCDAYENPFDDSWTSDRMWTELGEREVIPPITLNDMRADRVLSDWNVVRSNFQGARRTLVSATMWRRIQEVIEQKRQDPHWADRSVFTTRSRRSSIQPLIAETISRQEQDQLEREFEDRVVKPFLQDLGVDLIKRVTQQVAIRMYIGSRRVTNRADFVVYEDDDRQAPVAVVEAKRSIRREEELQAARQQAESYAGYLRAPAFVVMAPQGIWAYRLNFPGQSELLFTCTLLRPLSETDKMKLRNVLNPAGERDA